MVHSQNHLAAIGRDWRGDGYWLSGFVPDAYGAGDLDGVPVSKSKNMTYLLPKRHPCRADYLKAMP